MALAVVGLSGGIAAGKSTVAALLARRLPAVHLDADAVARRILNLPAVRARVARAFPGSVRRDGTFDRGGLARTVFGDPQALIRLESILHPLVRRALESEISGARARGRVVLLDAPLLQETGADLLCDRVVYVACPARVRRRRSRLARGWSAAQHRAREARQWSCRRKRARSHLVVENAGDRTRLRLDVARAAAAIRRLARSRRPARSR
ncbi:MAG: dephospho-CoA kinase [Planctomycetaceae bacterium]